MVEYKLLVFLAASALIMYFVPRRRFWSWATYILLYPFTRFLLALVLAGYILFKLKSWTLLFSVLNLIFAILNSFKINFLLYVAALIATFTILISHSHVNLISAAVVLVVVTIALVARRLVAAFQPSPIFNAYVRFLTWVMDYARRKVIKPVSLRGVDVSQYSVTEFQKRYGNLSTAILLSETCGFLQAKFKSYSNSGMAVATYLLALAMLFGLVTLFLALANFGIYRADPTAFKISGSHHFFDFVYYTLGAMTSQRSGEVLPISLGAKLVSMLEIGLGWLFAAGTFLSLYLAIRRGREDEAVEVAVARLKREEQQMNEFVEKEFALPLDEALAVLDKVHDGLLKFISMLRAARETL